ncbi:MAG: hypothetical protein FE78DRAFT_150311 [Acidomyces sp. 'richmondensis']|nr:MAG: hypothetical protein FE78DRAFT_150311 [Acidomyces sp. 'richmondensis']
MDAPTRNPRQDSQKRSRSIYCDERTNDEKRRRSESPHRHRRHHHNSGEVLTVRLPYHAQPLHKRDLNNHRALFAEYLEVQKQLDIDALSEDEVRGRWKSFVGKWNRNELAEGWYDAEVERKAKIRYASRDSSAPSNELVGSAREKVQGENEVCKDDDGEDDDYGPALPEVAHGRFGPVIPRFQDLQDRQEALKEEDEARVADLRYQRKQDRKLQKERLEELAPRAEPGSRERQLEKKRDASAANRAFRDAKEGGVVDELGDNDLMGDGEDDYRAKLKAQTRRKNEREIKKEEILRARAAEREEKMAELRRKEEKTMDMLRSLAKQRFG